MPFDSTDVSPSQSSKNKTLLWISVIVTVGLLILSLSRVGGIEWKVLYFKNGLADNWNDIFTKYLFIIVALERAVAVWVGVKRGENLKAWQKRVKRVKSIFNKPNNDSPTLEELQTNYNREKLIIKDIKDRDVKNSFLGITSPYNEGENIDQETEIKRLTAYLRTCQQVYEFKLAKYEEQSSALATKLVFFGGLILAISGISIVGDIIDASVLKSSAPQFYVYRVVDVAITGGLMGGGSRGFSLFISTLKQVFEKVKESNQ